MPICNLIEYSDNYWKTTTRRLWQCYSDKSFLNAIVDFPADNNNSALFQFKRKKQAEQKMMVQKSYNYGTIKTFS